MSSIEKRDEDDDEDEEDDDEEFEGLCIMKPLSDMELCEQHAALYSTLIGNMILQYYALCGIVPCNTEAGDEDDDELDGEEQDDEDEDDEDDDDDEDEEVANAPTMADLLSGKYVRKL